MKFTLTTLALINTHFVAICFGIVIAGKVLRFMDLLKAKIHKDTEG